MALIDNFGRLHDSLRISVTDRCNIRCFYCMPEEAVQYAPRQEILSFEEIEHFVRVAATLGVNKLRLTGGEPLLRRDLPRLIERLASIPGIHDLALTTNAVLLEKQAQALHDAVFAASTSTSIRSTVSDSNRSPAATISRACWPVSMRRCAPDSAA